MPSVKISELPVLSQLSANNANTVFVVVDKTTNTTSQFLATSLITGVLANTIFTDVQANTIIIQGVNATQNTRLNSIETINTNQNTSISIIESVNLTQNTNITTANNHAWAAFTKANNALANTNGVFTAGDFNISGDLTANGTVAPVKGFIYTPNIYPSAQTAVTISFANNSVVRAQTSAGLVVTLSSFVVGKSVEAWITNTAGGNQTFTHGCSATNSTVNSTTYAIPATSTIFVKYWCMDGTLANTFVAITHA
jgi:hypothetical protein